MIEGIGGFFLSLLTGPLEWLFEELAYRLGRSTLVLLSFGRVRPPRTRDSVRWLGALGTVELLALLLGGFVYYLHAV